jgi:acetyl coenzyme A synthetase (ADP forming)-like protein
VLPAASPPPLEAAATSLGPLFRPRAVAVIGPSHRHPNIGSRILEALVSAGFTGPIYPINPQAVEIGGLRAFASVRDAPAGVDLAVIAVPPAAVGGVVDDCAAAGVTAVIVITAGFAEIGAEGRALQERLVEKIRGYGMRMVGPNCMGLVNADPSVRLNASFSPIMPRSGTIALSSQSGALGLAIFELAVERQLGLSTFVSVGNKADISGNDLLEYWETDPSTRVILLYLESFGNPRRFASLARRIGRQKPIVVVKAGRTRAGSRAASSHTAALAANDVAVDALFRQSGVIRADTIDEMFDLAACLNAQPLPRGRRVTIVTNGGGPGILAADACDAAGLIVAELSDRTRARLAAVLPATASASNPIDLIASAGAKEFRDTIEAALTAEETDALIVLFTTVDRTCSDQIVDAIRDGIAAGRKGGATGKPVLACLMAQPGHPASIDVHSETVPAFAFPENAVRALGKVAAYATWRGEPPGRFPRFDDVRAAEAREVCLTAATAAPGGEAWLTDSEIRHVANAFGLPLATGRIATSADQAAVLATTLGFPVAVKLLSKRIQHKTDVGAVRLNVSDAPAVRRAFADIAGIARQMAPDDPFEGVLIQPMIAGGVETMMGVVHDPVFGPLVAFGLGGIYVEILGDVRFRVAPLTDRDVDELLHEIKGFRLLQGYRGHPAADLDALADVLLRLSRLAEEVPEILELDFNPVVAMPPGRGCRILDARIKVGRK